MTEESLKQKFDELAAKVPGMLETYFKASLKCGAFSVEDEEDNYILPKAILAAALEDLKYELRPKTSKVLVNNIYNQTFPTY
jgi:hypothetical protein